MSAKPTLSYYPLDVEIVGYVPNSWELSSLLITFNLGITAILGTAFVAVKLARPNITSSDLAASLWFTQCMCYQRN